MSVIESFAYFPIIVVTTNSRPRRTFANCRFLVLYNSVCTKDHMYMMLELVNGGDLFTKLDPSGNGLSEPIARKYMLQLASGLAHMHSKGIVHCDIKPENVLVHNDTIKVCDLGLAGTAGATRHGSATGTGAYMAPELLNRRTANPYKIEKAQDVWSFGIVLYAVLFADLPWEKAKPRDQDFRLFCSKGGVSARLHPFHFTSAPMMQFLGMVLSIIPNHRPTMANCVDFFSRKYPFYVGDRASLNISYGLKEVKAPPSNMKTKEWNFDTGHGEHREMDKCSSSSSLPSMLDVVEQQYMNMNPPSQTSSKQPPSSRNAKAQVALQQGMEELAL